MKKVLLGLLALAITQSYTYAAVSYGKPSNTVPASQVSYGQSASTTNYGKPATQNQALSTDQLQAGICIIANQGVHTVVTERQNGTAKSQTKKLLDNDLKKIRSSFKNTKFVQGIQTAWYRALDDIYQMPIQKDAQSKQIFISNITEEAFISCMNNLGAN